MNIPAKLKTILNRARQISPLKLAKRTGAAAVAFVILLPFALHGQETLARRSVKPAEHAAVEAKDTAKTADKAMTPALADVEALMGEGKSLNRSGDEKKNYLTEAAITPTPAPTVSLNNKKKEATAKTRKNSKAVPVATTAAPTETTAAPTETTAAPAETTAAPTEATAAPTEATEAPTEAAAAPEETAAAPEEAAAPAAEENTASDDGLVYIDGYKPMTQEEYRIFSLCDGNYYIGDTAADGSWGYDAGWCTWYVYNARINSGKYIPNNLGSADTWPYYAEADGFRVDNTPEVGAAGCDPGNDHVFFVEAVYDDGSILISEGGWNYSAFVYNKRVLSAGEASCYLYIH